MSRLRLLVSAATIATVFATAGVVLAQEEKPSRSGSAGDTETRDAAATGQTARQACATQARRDGFRSPRPRPPPAASETSALLPNGASSISESYDDWTFSCRIESGAKLCAISQSQGNRQTGQRAFMIELHTPKGGKTDGTILMPFGLKLEDGAILQLDDKDLDKGLRFSTCVPEGCLLPIALSTEATDAMKTGKDAHRRGAQPFHRQSGHIQSLARRLRPRARTPCRPRKLKAGPRRIGERGSRVAGSDAWNGGGARLPGLKAAGAPPEAIASESSRRENGRTAGRLVRC